MSDTEPGCIELIFDVNIVHLLMPRHLALEVTSNNHEWSYLWLESQPLPPSGVYEEGNRIREELCETTPGEYRPRSTWDEGHDNGQPLPSEARLVTRMLARKAFLVISKTSTYDNETYDGRHTHVSETDFREVMRQGSIGDISWLTSTPPIELP